MSARLVEVTAYGEVTCGIGWSNIVATMCLEFLVVMRFDFVALS